MFFFVCCFRQFRGACVLDEGVSELEPEDLSLLLCGANKIEISDWRAHTKVASCAGLSSARRELVIDWFWTAVETMNTNERLDIMLTFCGSSQLLELLPPEDSPHWSRPSQLLLFRELILFPSRIPASALSKSRG